MTHTHVGLAIDHDWDFLPNLDLDVLSLDLSNNRDVFFYYTDSIRRFLDRGGLIVWGIVPTGFEDIVTGAPEQVEPSFLERAKARLPRKPKRS
jgi:hypothetical protein